MSPEMFRKLASLGLSHEQMAGVLEIFDEDAGERRAKVKARVDKWRAKNKPETLRNVTERSETSQAVTKRLVRGEGNSSTQEIIEKEVKKEPSPPARSMRGSRIPDDFKPDIEAAVAEGLSRQEAERQALSFCDYWRARPGKEAMKLDWPATWRTWFRRRLDERPKSTAPPQRTVSDVLGDIKSGRLEVPSILDLINGKTDESPEHSGPTIDASFERSDLGSAGRSNQLYAFPSGRRS